TARKRSARCPMRRRSCGASGCPNSTPATTLRGSRLMMAPSTSPPIAATAWAFVAHLDAFASAAALTSTRNPDGRRFCAPVGPSSTKVKPLPVVARGFTFAAVSGPFRSCSSRAATLRPALRATLPAAPSSPELSADHWSDGARGCRCTDVPEGPKLFLDFVARSCSQGFCRHAAIASAQCMLQYRPCLRRRLADVNVAPQDNRAWLPAVSGAALTVDFGLRTRLLVGEAGAGDPALRDPCRAFNRRRCAGPDPHFDGLCRAQRQARFCDPEPSGRTHRLTR